MKLKSISIIGFKSFADRINIQYHDGITGVIGPNGSGKSNVIDAVRWVMGEQTAKSLRADEPTDIIFAGSQTRKPLSMAEVTLSFTNNGTRCPPEFMHLSEISISRRIYKSGEREYHMNGESCRLKDIVDFLMAIGLGSKSYSIIQQERRDRIIQAGPQDMREILEETAGISIFKTRRKEAEKRLDSTREHLTRLADTEIELTKQSDALKGQVEKAITKTNLLSELREREVTLLGHRVGQCRSEVLRLQTEIKQKSAEASQKAALAGEWESRANELKSEQLDIQLEIKTAEKTYDEKKITLTKYKERVNSYNNLRDERNKRKTQLSEELHREKDIFAGEEQRLQDFEAELSESEGTLSKLDAELEGLQDRLGEVEERLIVERSTGEEIRSEIRAIEDELGRLRIVNETLLKTMEKCSQSLLKAEHEVTEIKEKRIGFAADRKSVEENLGKFSVGLEAVAAERSRLQLEQEDLDAKIKDQELQRDTAKGALLEAQSHVNSLNKLASQGSGLSNGTKVLRERLAHQINGFIYESVTAHKLDEPYLELALPELLESALVRNSETLIELLDKAEEIGVSRVGLVVADLVPVLSPAEQKLQEQLANQQGLRCVGQRLESCKSAEVRNLFNRVYIANDEWLALKAMRLASELGVSQFLFVTERGTVISAGAHEITFGERSDGEGSGILARKRELEVHLQQKEHFEQELAKLEGALHALTSRRKVIQERNHTISEQLSKEKEEVLRLTGALQGLDLEIKHIDEGIGRHEAHCKDLRTEREEAQSQFAANQTKQNTLETEATKLQRDYNDFEESYSGIKEEKDEIQTQVQGRKTDRQLLVAKQGHIRSNYEQTSKQMVRLREKLDRCVMELAQCDEQISDKSTELSSLTNEISGLEIETTKMNEFLRELQAREAETAEEFLVMENRLKSERDTREATQKFIGEREQGIARFEVVLETALKDAWEKFQIHPNSLPAEGVADPKLDAQMEKRIREIGVEIQELGPVNERALDEFRDVEERRIFSLQQREDIEKSMENLQLSINEIEEMTKARFAEIFGKVNTQFQRLFPILFPGGHAELVMLLPEDLLNTGVEIQVRLPGKNQQNMNLFSGGEKALTAISLIFSLLKTTPAPFCFLDEVDAPLDEANVGRFNAVLEALSDEFQFVVITHNRRTMEVLDQIYGISMPEPGVSKLVSVDLTDVAPHLRKTSKTKDTRPGASASESPHTLVIPAQTQPQPDSENEESDN